MIPENVARLFDHLKGDQNRKSIFACFLLHDESSLWPISGAFNVTKEAIALMGFDYLCPKGTILKKNDWQYNNDTL